MSVIQIYYLFLSLLIAFIILDVEFRGVNPSLEEVFSRGIIFWQ